MRCHAVGRPASLMKHACQDFEKLGNVRRKSRGKSMTMIHSNTLIHENRIQVHEDACCVLLERQVPIIFPPRLLESELRTELRSSQPRVLYSRLVIQPVQWGTDFLAGLDFHMEEGTSMMECVSTARVSPVYKTAFGVDVTGFRFRVILLFNWVSYQVTNNSGTLLKSIRLRTVTSHPSAAHKAAPVVPSRFGWTSGVTYFGSVNENAPAF
jgi:hypothetical protein